MSDEDSYTHDCVRVYACYGATHTGLCTSNTHVHVCLRRRHYRLEPEPQSQNLQIVIAIKAPQLLIERTMWWNGDASLSLHETSDFVGYITRFHF